MYCVQQLIVKQGQVTKVTNRELGLGITDDMKTRVYPDVHLLGGKLISVEGMSVTTKAHQQHERLILFSMRYHNKCDSEPLTSI